MGTKKPAGGGIPQAGRQFDPDDRNCTGFDPVGGWLELSKPSRIKRQPERQWARGRP
jgi:hypothetical protein